MDTNVVESAELRVRRALAAIDNDTLGCFIEADRIGAEAAARASDDRKRRGAALGPLDGRTFAVKANIAVAGLHWSAGIAARRSVVAPQDARAVARLRAAGAIPVGTTNLAEGAFGATTRNPTFGIARNPVDPQRNAGGSSGGSAAAVAAGSVDFALGTDTLGSVRIPAAYCGIAGWKPSHGVIEPDGVVPLCASFDSVGVLAQSASELSLVSEQFGVRAIGGLRPPIVVPAGIGRYLLDDEIRAGFDDRLTGLRKYGYLAHHHDAALPDLGKLRRACLLVIEVEAAAYYSACISENPDGFSETFRTFLEFGRRARPERLAEARHHIRTGSAVLRRLFDGGAVVALPTTPHVAPPADSDGPDDAADLTAWTNALGCAAVSVPIRVDGSNLPVGIQFVGLGGSDATVLDVASKFEEGR